ncbi:MAG: signal peptidase II [Kiritimatiellaeota bacterium]|nr:signal peptidase II [Kiritimatiellota bacterium]
MLKRAIFPAVFFIALDQGLKLLVQRTFALGESRPVIPNYFDIHYVLNPGASWGWLAGWRHSSWFLAAFACAALVLLVVFREKIFPPRQPFPSLTLALFLGGIAGNLIDRVRLGEVVDFISVHWHRHHFPVFNIADMCISVGVALYIAGQSAQGRETRQQ